MAMAWRGPQRRALDYMYCTMMYAGTRLVTVVCSQVWRQRPRPALSPNRCRCSSMHFLASSRNI